MRTTTTTFSVSVPGTLTEAALAELHRLCFELLVGECDKETLTFNVETHVKEDN